MKVFDQKRISRLEFRETLYRRRYLVPNAVTLSNMFCGFLAIIYSTSDRFEKAVIAIGIAILLDGLDGRVARRLNATSKFGIEFDSFSDLISFGVAPAITIYNWCFRVPADEFGVFVCFVYALCAASRLARFNVADQNLRAFTGLPTPGAAGVVAALIYAMPMTENSLLVLVLATLVMATLSYLMVSQLEYFSVKQLKIGKVRTLGRVALGILIALIWYNSRLGWLILAFVYAYSAPVRAVWPKALNKRPADSALRTKESA